MIPEKEFEYFSDFEKLHFWSSPNQRTGVLNRFCPYGYAFCRELKLASDARYLQTWTCSWLRGANMNLSCAELGGP